MVKEKIYIEILVSDLQMVLTAYERKSDTQLQQKISDVCD